MRYLQLRLPVLVDACLDRSARESVLQQRRNQGIDCFHTIATMTPCSASAAFSVPGVLG
jgi:hypothetical protein